MKILFLTQRVPFLPNKGDKLRAFNIIKYLSKSHSVSLVCFADDINDLNYIGELKKVCHSVDIIPLNAFLAKIRCLFCLFSSTPLTLAYFYSKKLTKLVKEKVKSEKLDLIFIYSSSMAQYALNTNSIPKIMDFIDMDSDKWRQYSEHSSFIKKFIYKIEEKRLRKYEKIIAGSVEHCIVSSEAEAELFKTFIPDKPVSVITNGVDFEYFKPGSGKYEENRLVFIGQMDYFANIDAILYFYQQILPLIKERIPSIKLYIVGRNPPREITRLGKNNGIVVTGFVEDTRLYTRESAVCIIPLRIARGVQNKVLEAMAMGVPVVATPEAVKGINARQKDMFVESEPRNFALRVVELLNNRELRREVAANARKTIEERYNWDKNLSRINEILDEIVK